MHLIHTAFDCGGEIVACNDTFGKGSLSEVWLECALCGQHIMVVSNVKDLDSPVAGIVRPPQPELE